MTFFDELDHTQAIDSQLPSARDLTAAMAGRLAVDNPRRVILLGAFLLATIEDWIHPETVTTERGDTGEEMLWSLGVFDITTVVRAQLIDIINRAVQHAEVGAAVDAVARAWQAYQRTIRHRAGTGSEARHQQATGALIEACACYTRLRISTRTDAIPPAAVVSAHPVPTAARSAPVPKPASTA